MILNAIVEKLKEMVLERGFEVHHTTLNRWVLAYALLNEKRLRIFRKSHCGSIRIDETYVKIKGQWHAISIGPSTNTGTRPISC